MYQKQQKRQKLWNYISSILRCYKSKICNKYAVICQEYAQNIQTLDCICKIYKKYTQNMSDNMHVVCSWMLKICCYMSKIFTQNFRVAISRQRVVVPRKFILCFKNLKWDQRTSNVHTCWPGAWAAMIGI